MSKIMFKETVLGTHYWSDCPHNEVSFLKNEHHHDFTIRVQCEVSHDDRDLEWIMLRIALKKFMKAQFDIHDEIFRFGGMSCEMIADAITHYFNSIYNASRNWKVSVSEDEVYTGGEW